MLADNFCREVLTRWGRRVSLFCCVPSSRKRAKECKALQQKGPGQQNAVVSRVTGRSYELHELPGAPRKQKKAESCTSIATISTNHNRRKAMSELQKIRIRMKAYDHALLDKYAAKIVETVKKTGAEVSGPIPLPTEKEVVTIIRAVHKYKDSREQFEQRTHKRLIDVTNATNKTVEALQKLDAPAGVDIYVKL